MMTLEDQLIFIVNYLKTPLRMQKNLLKKQNQKKKKKLEKKPEKKKK